MWNFLTVAWSLLRHSKASVDKLMVLLDKSLVIAQSRGWSSSNRAKQKVKVRPKVEPKPMLSSEFEDESAGP